MAKIHVSTRPIIDLTTYSNGRYIYAIDDVDNEYRIIKNVLSRLSKRTVQKIHTSGSLLPTVVVAMPLTQKVMENAEALIRKTVSTIYGADETAAVETLLCRNNKVFMSCNRVAFVAVVVKVW